MQIIQIIIFTILVMLTSCSDIIDNYDITPDQKVEVVIGASRTITTRTSIGDDAESVGWCVGDQIALWADGESNSNSNLVGQMFQLNYYGATYDNAEFSSTISSMDESQDYSYSSFYPYQNATISGKSVSYSIPATQSGEYDGEYDYRVASAVSGRALDQSTKDNVVLSFESIAHALKITIPPGCNKLGEKIQRLKLTFPTNVVGGATYNMSTMTSSTSPTESTVTLDLSDNPIDEGDVVWMFIHPCSGVTGNIVVKGYGVDDNISCDYEIVVSNRTFAAGHITPVNTEIGEALPMTTIQLKITGNNLGEDLTQIHFTAPDGAIFNESDSNAVTVKNDGSGIYKVSYIAELYGDKFKGNSISVQYESENTLFSSDAIAVSSVTEDATTTFSRVVPYLLEEDFSTLSSFSYHDNPGIGEWDSDAAEGHDGVSLSSSSYGSLSASGWTANRCGSDGGGVLRIMGRYEGTTIITGHYEGRLDSPMLSKIKTGSTVSVYVTYDYKCGRYSKYHNGKVFGSSYVNGGNGTGTYNVGSTEADSNDGIDGEDDIESCYYASYQDMPDTDGDDSNSSQNYNNLNYDGNFIVSATSSTRLAWRATSTMSNAPVLGANGNFWMYIDNIKVTIK